MEDKSTHFIFNGKKILISSDLRLIFDFLKEIEKEVESFLGFDKKLESIRKQHLETIKFVQVLAKKLKENSIDFSFTFSEPPATIVDKLKMNHPVRSKFIVLFANLETLLCLSIAYENKTSDKKVIIDKAMDPGVTKSFLENFCLNKENNWGKKNQKRLENITADNLRKLRNALTHFFSVDKDLQIADAMLDDKSRKLEQATNFKAKFISPEDLYEIIKGALVLMMKKWTDDCLDSINKKSNEFKEKILSVNSIIKDCGAVIVKNSQINI
jgi:hypothetical protein